MKRNLPVFIAFFLLCAISHNVSAQIVITPQSSAEQLAQRLVGDGVTISNVRFTGNALMAGLFKQTNTNIGIDSGIVLTNGLAKGRPGISYGVNGSGFETAATYLPIISAICPAITISITSSVAVPKMPVYWNLISRRWATALSSATFLVPKNTRRNSFVSIMMHLHFSFPDQDLPACKTLLWSPILPHPFRSVM